MACALSIGIISLAKFFPPDVKMTNVSRTVGARSGGGGIGYQLTHTTPIDW
jgi:hypothetical protein